MSTTTLATKSKLNPPEQEVPTSCSASSVSTLYSMLDDQSLFHPDRTLLIQAQGVGCFRLPFPNRQLEIEIVHPNGHAAYLSTRNRVRSGNSVLSNAKLGDLIRTEYFFGPNRNPVVHLLQPSTGNPEERQIHLRGEWTSRSVRFTTPAGSDLRWWYAKEKKWPGGRKVSLIVLSAVEDSAKGEKNASQIPERRLAQLLRCAATRTPQTSRTSAGNGGTLQMNEAALREFGVEEALVVATCLTMLKREVDRRRMIQMMGVAGAAGSGP
ncbi:hypothetical protein F1880_004638 [Penicillium rolfsii]|nr:hypothetical protein F1880_004638 [Penicillium rolfsii]